MITERLVSAKVHPHCLPIPHSLSVMRYSAMPAVFVGLSWFAQRADAFVVGPPRGSSSNQRTCSGCLSQYQPLSTMEATRSLAVGTAQLEARQKRKSLDTMSASSQENEAKWETTPKAMSGSDPEEMMRQMSIPDLVQKLQVTESTFGQVHPQVASALIPLSQALYANGDLGPARESCTRALKILQVAFGPSPRVETAECLHTMAMIQQAESPQVGDTALGSQNMALELAMRVCGPDSIEVAAYARCLAQMSEDYSKYLAPGLPRPFYMPNPVPLYRQTLNILEKLIGPNDPEVASSLDDLASALLFWRDDEYTEVKAVTLLPEAEMLAARSLAISSASLGPEHLMTAGREHNLGMVKRGQGREEEAKKNFQRALEIREKTLGADHPDTKFSRDLAEGKDGGLVEP